MGEDHRTKKQIRRDDIQADYEAQEFKMKLAALPELAAIDADIRKIRKLETGRTVKELGLVDKQLDDIKKRQKGALLAYMKEEERKKPSPTSSHIKTPTSENLVLLMAAGDCSQSEIGEVLGLCRQKVASEYREQLDLAKELLDEGVQCGLKFTAVLAYYDKARTGAHHLYVTNKSKVKPQGKIDISNSDGSLMPLVFVESNGRENQLNRAEILKQLAARRGDTVEGEVISSE